MLAGSCPSAPGVRDELAQTRHFAGGSVGKQPDNDPAARVGRVRARQLRARSGLWQPTKRTLMIVTHGVSSC